MQNPEIHREMVEWLDCRNGFAWGCLGSKGKVEVLGNLGIQGSPCVFNIRTKKLNNIKSCKF